MWFKKKKKNDAFPKWASLPDFKEDTMLVLLSAVLYSRPWVL